MKIYLSIVKDNQLKKEKEFTQLPVERKAILLELLIDYYALQKDNSLKPQKRAVQSERAATFVSKVL
ncbi:hypothetical protein KKA14_20695 [bacterium]|nr:hypothetical protein [bacterium]